jgi:hypothetical protein
MRRERCIRVLLVQPERAQLGRHRRIWDDNIKVDRQEVGWEGMDWTGLDQDKGQGAGA